MVDAKEIYNNLVNLAESDAGFILTEQESLGQKFHIFTYRLVKYTDFLLPHALESRGITFDVTDSADVKIVSWPFEKFFNMNENPMTENLDFSSLKEIALKADGSMMSTIMVGDKLVLKSKSSILSDVAIDASSYLNTQSELKEELLTLYQHGYTTIMEWVAPFNRIVCHYEKPDLIVLGVRSMLDGSYLTKQQCADMGLKTIVDKWAEQFEYMNPHEVYRQEGIEGYVFWLNNGQRVKVKTEWYLVRHSLRSSIDSKEKLCAAILNEELDDIRSFFHDNPGVIERLEKAERIIVDYYNHLIDVTQNFYKENSELTRKDFAIKAKSEMEPVEFSIVMMLYSDKKVDYKQFVQKQAKSLLNDI